MLTLCHKIVVTIDAGEIEQAHPIGHFRAKNRTIIACFLNYNSRQRIFQECKKVKEQDVVVTEYFEKENSGKTKLFQSIMQAACKSSGKYKAHLSVDKLIGNGKSYSSDDLSKLPKELQPQNLCNVV